MPQIYSRLTTAKGGRSSKKSKCSTTQTRGPWRSLKITSLSFKIHFRVQKLESDLLEMRLDKRSHDSHSRTLSNTQEHFQNEVCKPFYYIPNTCFALESPHFNICLNLWEADGWHRAERTFERNRGEGHDQGRREKEPAERSPDFWRGEIKVCGVKTKKNGFAAPCDTSVIFVGAESENGAGSNRRDEQEA